MYLLSYVMFSANIFTLKVIVLLMLHRVPLIYAFSCKKIRTCTRGKDTTATVSFFKPITNVFKLKDPLTNIQSYAGTH